MKKIYLFVLSIILLINIPVYSIDLDYTIDDAIRKNYHLDKPIQGGTKPVQTQVKQTPVQQKTEPLPKLPAVPKNVVYSNQYQTPAKPSNQIQNNIKSTRKALPLRKGMSFDLVNTNTISDRQRVGTNIIFTNQKPIKTAYYTIPQGTKFVGKVVKSHSPQLTGNGGLVSISIVTVILGGDYQHINTTITKVGGKRVYFENIKGKRTYLKNTVAKGKWGRNTFRKTKNVSVTLAKDKTTVILSPFTFAYGAAMGGISTATSPVISIFCKGKHVNIPANTQFRIKFNQDVKLYY